MKIRETIKRNFTEQNKRRFISYLKRNGIKASYYKVLERLKRDKAEGSYSALVHKGRLMEEELKRQRLTRFPLEYKISLVVPAYETVPRYLKQMLGSVFDQTYENWELCIADGSRDDKVQNAIMDAIGKHGDRTIGRKIKYQRLRENKGISGNTNAAISMASGDYIGFLDHDDLLTKDALFEVVKTLNETAYKRGNVIENSTLLVYSNEDKIDEDMTRYFDLHEKPDFDIDLLRSNNYICHFLVIEAGIINKTGGLLKEYDGAQDYDLIFRSVELMKKSNIKHIPKVLYHWRASDASTAANPENKLYAYEAGKRAIEEHLKRAGIRAKVLYTEHLGFFRVRYDAAGLNCVTVTPGELALYDPEMLKNIRADAVMIMDKKYRPLSKDYMEELLGNFSRSEVGAVGGKILSRDGRIDNAGFVFDEHMRLKPRFHGMNGNFSGYMHRASIQNTVNGLDKGCVMVRTAVLVDLLSKEKRGNGRDKDIDLARISGDHVCVYDPFARFRRV